MYTVKKKLRVTAGVVVACIIMVLLLFTISGSGQASGIFITEIMTNPYGKETSIPGGDSHEFVEVVNTGRDTFEFSGVCITDGSESDSLVECRGNEFHTECITGSNLLKPGGVALIMDPEYFSQINSENLYSIPEGTLILLTSDSDIGNGLAESDGIVLYSGTRKECSEIIAASNRISECPIPTKSIDNGLDRVRDGFSVVPEYLLFDSESFQECADTATPGFIPRIKGGWLTEWKGQLKNDSVVETEVRCVDVSSGGKSLSYIVTAPDTVIDSGLVNRSGDLFDVRTLLPVSYLEFGFNIMDKETQYTWQLDISDLWIPEGAIVISEIFPKGNNDVPEWFEVHNVSDMSVQLQGWEYGKSNETEAITSRGFMLEPGEFCAVVKDARKFCDAYRADVSMIEPDNWVTLYNTEDTLILRDSREVIREYVVYSDTWFSNWRDGSVQRIDYTEKALSSSNWVIAEVPTPGAPNKERVWREGESSITAGPFPFTPDSDGESDRLRIGIQLAPGAEVDIYIIGFNGREYKRFERIRVSEVFWDGTTDDMGKAPSGPFFVIAQVKDGDRTRKIRKRGMLWRR